MHSLTNLFTFSTVTLYQPISNLYSHINEVKLQLLQYSFSTWFQWTWVSQGAIVNPNLGNAYLACSQTQWLQHHCQQTALRLNRWTIQSTHACDSFGNACKQIQSHGMNEQLVLKQSIQQQRYARFGAKVCQQIYERGPTANKTRTGDN